MTVSLYWPRVLPQTLPIDTEWESQPNVVESDMEFGPKKRRRRFTAASKFITPDASRFVLSATQMNTMVHFYEEMTASGSLRFLWTDPIPGWGILQMRFKSVPKFRALTPTHWRCQVTFEVLPNDAA